MRKLTSSHFIRILVVPLCLMIFLSMRTSVQAASDYFAMSQISEDNVSEISTHQFIFFRRAMQNLYSYILQFESEILPELTVEEQKMWFGTKSLLRQDNLARKQSHQGMEGIIKLKLSSNQSLFEKPEGLRMAVSGASLSDPIWINDTLLTSGREKIDYILACQLLLHEIGHKIPNENIKAVYQISSLLNQKLENRMEKFEFKESVIKVFFIESDKIPAEELAHVDKNEIMLWEETPKRFGYHSLRNVIQIDKLQAKNLFYRTTILKEVFTNFKDSVIRFTIPFVKEFFYLKEEATNKYQVESIIPQSNLNKYSLAHDLVIDLTSSGLNFHIENGTRLSLSDQFSIESINLKTKFVLITGIIQVEDLHKMYESIELNLELPNNHRVQVPAEKVEFLNTTMARVHFHLTLKEPSSFPTVLMNHITLKTKHREVRRILLPKEIQWDRVRSKPEIPPIEFTRGKPWFDPTTQELTLEMQTDAKAPFLFFDLVFSNKTFFAEGDSNKFNEHTPMHIIELNRIPSKYIKQTHNELGILVYIKVPLIEIAQTKIFMPNFDNQADNLVSRHEQVGVKIQSDIAMLRYVDAYLRTKTMELTNLPTITLNGVAQLRVKKQAQDSSMRCQDLFK